MANAKTDKSSAPGEDQSMEEILQSIRKIIAEENDDPSEDAPAMEIIEESNSILELTDSIQDDGSVVNLKEDGDILDEIDDALEPRPEPKAKAKPAPEPEPEEEPEEEFMEEAPPPPPAPRPRPVKAPSGAGLVSDASIAASAQALKGLRMPGDFGAMPFLSGNTVEALVQQMLRPMLKEWLDANLPGIVQQEVQREVQRISMEQE